MRSVYHDSLEDAPYVRDAMPTLIGVLPHEERPTWPARWAGKLRTRRRAEGPPTFWHPGNVGGPFHLYSLANPASTAAA